MNKLFIQDINIEWNKISSDSYLRKIDSIKNLEHLEFSTPITFFVGENGTGKSTILEAIAVKFGFNPEGGTKNYNFSTFDSHSELCEAITLSKGYRKEAWGYFLRAESFYNVASKTEDYRDGDDIGIYYNKYGGKAFHEQSHGESFINLLQGNFVPNGIYILDEPEAALSPQRQLTLLMEMTRLSRQGAQFIIASHSPILLGIPDADIFSFDNGQVSLCKYEDTECFQVMEMFINNREYLLNRLLNS